MSGLAFLFPGQGSQWSGMGHDLVETFPECRAVFDAADHELGRSISELCFSGSDEELALTENTQPAILAVSVAALRVLEAAGIRPQAAAGHSLGEYSAHVAAGTIDAMDALRIVQARGRFMQQAVPAGEGAMAAVLGLEPAAVAQLCRDVAGGQVVSPANFNSPSQIVIAGHVPAVQRAIDGAIEIGARRAVRLPVSAPFHCSLMRPAAIRLRPILEDVEFLDPAFPVTTNVDAAPVTDGSAAREALRRQVDAPVHWHESVEALLASGCDTFVEVGPGKVLSGLLRRFRRDVRVFNAGDAAGVQETVRELAG